MIFVNKIDQARGSIQGLLEALQPMSTLAADRPPDPDPRRREDHRLRRYRARARLIITGPASPPSRRRSPPTSPTREALERVHMLEQLADHDDALLEQLLMDEVPDRETVFADLAKETAPEPDRAGPVRLGAERLRRAPAA